LLNKNVPSLSTPKQFPTLLHFKKFLLCLIIFQSANKTTLMPPPIPNSQSVQYKMPQQQSAATNHHAVGQKQTASSGASRIRQRQEMKPIEIDVALFLVASPIIYCDEAGAKTSIASD
jgi:hypothetical protein